MQPAFFQPHRILIASFLACHWTAWSLAAASAECWLTNLDRSSLFQKQNPDLVFQGNAATAPTLEVDAGRTFQSMEGFGYTLTGGSAQLLMRMSAPARAALLHELFAWDGTNIGVSYLRVSIGSSDLNDHTFSYDDLPAGETDPNLTRFSLAPDQADLIPVLQQIVAINPVIKILGSPWSAPPWMKDNHQTRGGSLQPHYYEAYAGYFVKYLQGMQAHGISIDAITPQNEPLHPGNNPSMYMPATNQAMFIKNHLGPALQRAGLRTKIICYDHNADHPDYPLTILNDPQARPFVDGSAFHLYGGTIDALDQVHAAYPEKNLYFTEQWIGAPGNLPGDLGWHVDHLIVGASRHWCRTVLEWNMAADPDQQPHTDGGCDRCLGALTIAGNQVIRNPAYYIIAQASKFVRPGSLRIASTTVDGLANVAFKNPAGQTVLIVLNRKNNPSTFNVRSQDRMLTATLPAASVGTYVWQK
jgi:glucosylceramidase